MRGKNKIA